MTDTEYPSGLFSSEFTGAEPFLADHVIGGRKILPGVVYLEMSRAAVALSASVGEGDMIVLRDSIFIQPIAVSGPCRVDVSVYPGKDGEFGIEVRTVQGIHFQTKASVRGRRAEADPALEGKAFLDLPSQELKCTVPGPTRQQFYANFKKKGIDLGPSHRGIESIRLGDGCALVACSLPGSSRLGMELNPGMFDSFIQSGDVLGGDQGRVRLPFAINRTEIRGPLTDRMRGLIAKAGPGVDYTLVDETGAIRVAITGYVGREVDPHAELLAYRPEWLEKPERRESGGSAVAGAATVIQNASSYADLVDSVLNVARQLAQAKPDRQTLEVRLPGDKPAWRGIVGLLKTVSLEHPNLSWRLKEGERELELRYAPVNLSAAPAYAWPDGKTILITGGLGGLGMLIAREIAEASQGCTLILAGRSEPDGLRREFMRSLTSLGATVVHARCDIARPAEVDSLLARHPVIHGILHAAGTLDDGLLVRKTREGVDRVLGPKVAGTEYLDRATAHLRLDYFVAFSSIAGTLGNAGQADYAAANGYLDAFMRERARLVGEKKRHGRSISVNWPLWESEGMALDEETKKNLLQVFKIRPLPAALGIQALRQILAGGESQLVVLYGSEKAIGPMMGVPAAEGNGASAEKPAQGVTEAAPDDGLQRKILLEVRSQTAEHLKRDAAGLSDGADWAEFGFDSILLTAFANKLNARFNLNLMPSVFFEATNMDTFSRYLAGNYGDRLAQSLSGGVTPAPPLRTRPEGKAEPDAPGNDFFAQGFRKAYAARGGYREKDIAVVGMSCRTAGASNAGEFWRMLNEGRDMITEIPPDRWDWRDYPGVSKWGSFIEGVDEFDSIFFGISPAEAAYMSPEQRLMMRYVWECLEDAGYSPERLRGSNTGLFLGIGPSGYSHYLKDAAVEAYSATGMTPSIGPNRISYLMDWHGPSNPIETACSSALVAVHRAVEAMRAGHCDQAIAGAVNLLLSPDVYVSFAKSGMLCEDGRCKTFSDKANGYARGEGVGMLMLKPLKNALRDGDNIHAVVKGTAENHGGKANSLTAPNPRSQSAVIKRAIADSGLDFSRLGYIECHGTGTALGDPVEIDGLKAVAAELMPGALARPTCKLGSVKSNIGHLEIAAGAAGLIKAILQLKHKRIVKSLHCDRINPYIDLAGSPFSVAREACGWEVEPGRTRVAGVSSFGFGGVNSHVVLEEYRASEVPEKAAVGADRPQVLVLSARTEESLREQVFRYREFLAASQETGESLQRMAYTLQVGRSEMQERLAFVAASKTEWAEQMESFLRDGAGGKAYRGTVRAGAGNRDGNGMAQPHAGGPEAGGPQVNGPQVSGPQKAAELWVKGARIDWETLHG